MSRVEDSALDRARQSVYETLWHSAMRVDQWFGSEHPASDYQQLSGSLSPALLWDRHYGWRAPLRFDINWNLPELNHQLHLFAGRFDANEFVGESAEPSGTMPRQFGATTEDQTLLGLVFGAPAHAGNSFNVGAGIHLALPLNPYVKGSYQFTHGSLQEMLLSWKETAFWERRQGAGLTSRFDLEHMLFDRWLLRGTVSETLSEASRGFSGWTSLSLMGSLSELRAVAVEVEADGQTDAAVPLHSMGLVGAYRQSILRRWLILEIRGSASWPKDFPQQARRFDPGLGAGFEILLGKQRFLARPVTF